MANYWEALDNPTMASLVPLASGYSASPHHPAEARTSPRLWPSLLQNVYRPDDRPSNCGACRASYKVVLVDREDRGCAFTLLKMLKLSRLSQLHEVLCTLWR